MERDEYGHYINDAGVEIRTSTDKYGKDHIDIYDSCPAENSDHASIHINYDSDTGKGTIVDTTNGDKETTDTQCYHFLFSSFYHLLYKQKENHT